MGKAIIAIGVVVLLIGLTGFTPITNWLPAALNSLFGDSHTYFRIVGTDRSSGLVPASLIAVGLILCGVGFAFPRRREKR